MHIGQPHHMRMSSILVYPAKHTGHYNSIIYTEDFHASLRAMTKLPRKVVKRDTFQAVLRHNLVLPAPGATPMHACLVTYPYPPTKFPCVHVRAVGWGGVMNLQAVKPLKTKHLHKKARHGTNYPTPFYMFVPRPEPSVNPQHYIPTAPNSLE